MKMVPYCEEKHGKYFVDQKPRGYVRGDIDAQGRMWTSYIPVTQISYEERQALNAFTAKFIDLPCMSSVASLYEFCKQYPDAQIGDPEDKSFFFFAKDEFSAYLIKVVCIEKDYNFYINAYRLQTE